jgi:glycosyltransferase involved in cell wall biosynthesis
MADSGREIWDCPHTLTIQMMYQSLEMLHQEKRFDFFHSFFLYPVGYVTGLLAKRYGVPCVATLVGNDIKKYTFSPEKVAVCRNGLENADRVIALSRDLVEMADALTAIKQKSGTIYNSVVIPDQAWSADRPPGHSFRVGCAGIFKYAKGLPYLFKALAQLRPETSLVLELSGELRNSERPIYEQVLERTGIQDLVVLREPLPHYRVPEWLRSLDLFVLPSLSEGCPNILMEALASGVPSIATRTGANEDLIDDHVSGLLVPWGDSAALARALREMLENKDLRQTLGSAARLKMQYFSLERERRDWERIYRDLIGF